MVRIMVTGARGFVGAHLVQELRKRHVVLPTDIEDADLSVPGAAIDLVFDQEPDYVVHLAAMYGRLLCRDKPHASVTINAAATTELAAACATAGVPVLYASSSEVYGDHGEDTITEDSELRTPTTIYGLSKRWGEEALRLYLHSDLLTVVRLNMLYGPHQRGGYGCCALSTFIRNAMEGEPMNVHRDTSRSWLYITDAVRALCLLIENGHTGTFNLGNAWERRTMEDVAFLVREHFPGAPINIVDPPEGQIRHKNYDASRMDELGWGPEVPLEVGVHCTVEDALKYGIRDYST